MSTLTEAADQAGAHKTLQQAKHDLDIALRLCALELGFLVAAAKQAVAFPAYISMAEHQLEKYELADRAYKEALDREGDR